MKTMIKAFTLRLRIFGAILYSFGIIAFGGLLVLVGTPLLLTAVFAVPRVHIPREITSPNEISRMC